MLIPNKMAFVAFQALDNRVQELLDGAFEKEMADLNLPQDKEDHIKACNEFVTVYNFMLEVFINDPAHVGMAREMGFVTRVFK